MNCLHSRVRAFSLSTALWAIASLWSLTSCGVSGTMCSSKYSMRCCSYWMASVSWFTYYVTRSSTLISKTVTERSSLLTTSFTSSFSESNCSFSCCSCAFSSSNFTWREKFSYSAALHFSTSTPCTCVKAWVAFSISSCAHRRRASTVSTRMWSSAGSSPNSGSLGAVEDARLDYRACYTPWSSVSIQSYISSCFASCFSTISTEAYCRDSMRKSKSSEVRIVCILVMVAFDFFWEEGFRGEPFLIFRG
jgi:hypothetical protein